MQISDSTMKEIQRKAESGIQMSAPTAEKQKLYDQFQQQATNTIKQKAQSGQALSSANDWKNNIYQQYSQQSNSPQNTQSITSPNSGVTQAPKQYAFGGYDKGNSIVSDDYLNKARSYQIGAGKGEPYQGFIGNSYEAGSLLDDDGLRELAYHLQQRDATNSNYGSMLTKYQQEEMSKGYGLSNDWATNYADLQEEARKNFAYEDFLADMYGTNSMNDTTWGGLSRKDLGFNEAGDITTLEQRQAEGIQDDPWGINSLYFNDPRHKGQQFAYMDYFDPTAYANQRAQAEDGRGIEYWYNTNFAREQGYVDDAWDYNANNFADWRDLMHDEMVGKYAVGGTNWGGNQTNLEAYQALIQSVMAGNYGTPSGSTGSGSSNSGGTSNSGSASGKLNEEQKALAELIEQYNAQQRGAIR